MALGLSASSFPFWLSWLVKKTNPRASTPFRRTIRAEGTPVRVAVARVMASGSGSPVARASANHRWNWTIGSGSTSASRNPAPSAVEAMLLEVDAHAARRKAEDLLDGIRIGHIVEIEQLQGG